MASVVVALAALLAISAGALAAALHSPATSVPGGWELRRVAILGGAATGPRSEATELHLGLDNCSGGAPRSMTKTTSVQETSTRVIVSVTGPVWTGENQAACRDGVTVTLSSSLGQRQVVDATTGHTVPIAHNGG